jgi:hypothetical protein
MSINKLLFTIAALALATHGAAAAEAAMKKQFISIGTGGVTSVYYRAGGAICRLVDKEQKLHGVRCLVEATSGSVYNLNSIRIGELDMGVARSNWQYHAYRGTSKFKAEGPFSGLRAIFSIHAQPISIVARRNSRVRTVGDLVGKRVNIGVLGSSIERTWNIVWSAMGKKNSDLQQALRMRLADMPLALCENRIDAFVWITSNPADLNKEATANCDAVFAAVENDAIAELVKGKPFYRWAWIPGGMYRGNPRDIRTFGVGATFVSSTQTSVDTVYAIVKSVFNNFQQFKKLHPAFAMLTEKEMISEALSAPLHDGAVKYYKERGWM